MSVLSVKQLLTYLCVCLIFRIPLIITTFEIYTTSTNSLFFCCCWYSVTTIFLGTQKFTKPWQTQLYAQNCGAISFMKQCHVIDQGKITTYPIFRASVTHIHFSCICRHVQGMHPLLISRLITPCNTSQC